MPAPLDIQLVKFIKANKIHKYYQHYKTKGYYKIKSLSFHTEEVDSQGHPAIMVNYVDQYGVRWTRPYDMFFSTVEHDLNEAVAQSSATGVSLNDLLAVQTPRFKKVSAKEYYLSKLKSKTA
ncbi:hypothetical protein SP15_169 [Bacillus phage SP-15]|uniref:DUF1653 domain-containing protein n=1 Tax=Bacillus phage SP-15 TaxID=1792032 RepID=A0A127AWK7_9CAUD|nr:hypothetical protein SP15_169 [Bacillus phage SP-15]AMM44967.1 hypothetical protein SP15_169 [Bacillus phage SP-15]